MGLTRFDMIYEACMFASIAGIRTVLGFQVAGVGK